jgi:ATP-binding cassette subfamily B protein
MEDGRIVQRGTHEELMRMPGPYLRVANLQLIDARDLQLLGLTGGEAKS